MTPSNPSPDTGAGTPLTAAERHELRATHRDNFADLNGDRDRIERPACIIDGEPWPCDVVRLLDTLDAAQSRPATDPAGLDALIAELLSLAEPHDGQELLWAKGKDYGLRLAVGVIDQWRARLSVADGPGPEDEWFGQSLGVPDPRLERRSR